MCLTVSILLEIRQHWLTIPYRRVYGAQHHRPRRSFPNRINKERSKVSKDQKKQASKIVKQANDRSGGLQLLANPFNDRSRLAEKFVVERYQTELFSPTLSLPDEHDVNGVSDGLRFDAIPGSVGKNPDQRDDRISDRRPPLRGCGQWRPDSNRVAYP